MHFIDPMTKELSFKKSWFFFEDCYFVIVSDIQQTKKREVYTVLDQREYREPFNYDKINENPSWMIHDKTGYLFPSSKASLSVDTSQVTGDWSSVGVGGGKGKVTKKVFKAQLHSKENKVEYIAVPGTNQIEFNQLTNTSSDRYWARSLRIISSTRHVHAVHHSIRKTFGICFYSASSLNISDSIRISASSPLVVMLDNQVKGTVKVTVSDPTQKLTSTSIRIQGSHLSQKVINVLFKQGEEAGSSTSMFLTGDLL
eukprot:TRINITY_DN5287_c0_g1_i3.p1 TRINITY_DN5287_c0_g1~~TRINITY_DN5287_c0_g1_i3.p1  ORF type:complete len:256 (-),score=47.70 TRINITY_DN5287_c0_g1_i3:34-801(-)